MIKVINKPAPRELHVKPSSYTGETVPCGKNYGWWEDKERESQRAVKEFSMKEFLKERELFLEESKTDIAPCDIYVDPRTQKVMPVRGRVFEDEEGKTYHQARLIRVFMRMMSANCKRLIDGAEIGDWIEHKGRRLKRVA